MRVSNCQKVFCLRGARVRHGNIHQPLGDPHNILPGKYLEWESNVFDHRIYNSIYPKRGSTRRGERARAAYQGTVQLRTNVVLV